MLLAIQLGVSKAFFLVSFCCFMCSTTHLLTSLCYHAEELCKGGRPEWSELSITFLYFGLIGCSLLRCICLAKMQCLIAATETVLAKVGNIKAEAVSGICRNWAWERKCWFHHFSFFLSVCLLHCVGFCFFWFAFLLLFSFIVMPIFFDSKPIQPLCFELPTAYIKIKTRWQQYGTLMYRWVTWGTAHLARCNDRCPTSCCLNLKCHHTWWSLHPSVKNKMDVHVKPL